MSPNAAATSPGAHPYISRGSDLLKLENDRNQLPPLDTQLDHRNEPRLSSETQSEEDYEENIRPSIINALDNQSCPSLEEENSSEEAGSELTSSAATQSFDMLQSPSTNPRKGSSCQDEVNTMKPRSRQKFRDFAFSRQVSTFDSQSEAASSSPFHGFYTLFWLSIALLIIKISANNWHKYGHPLGSNDIMKAMFHKDVIVLLLSDGIMCSLTGVSWLLQRLSLSGKINWDNEGWILQHIWQALFIAAAVKWTVFRDWPWTHTVFFVLHALVMLMKQHSYAFYNGHLSTIHHRRQLLESKLKIMDVKECNQFSSATSATAETAKTASRRMGRSENATSEQKKQLDIAEIINFVDSDTFLSQDQTFLFCCIMKEEIDALADELKGTASSISRAYPNNLTFLGHYEWIPLPTVVYEIEYPRTETISWAYVAEKVAAMIGIIFVMIQVSQYYIYPVVLVTVEMRENQVPLAARFKEFPWLLSELIFPFMMEYLLTWYLIWETVLNILAELTYFADRHFYDAWWNSVSWDQFARDWNRPVHVFLLRHVYHSSISSLKINKHTATFITFLLSACVHEFIMWCIFKKLRGYLLLLQMCQLPLVRLSQTSWLRGRKTLGNLIFWLGIFTGPSVLCSLYLIL